jgi:hypothetical protein
MSAKVYHRHDTDRHTGNLTGLQTNQGMLAASASELLYWTQTDIVYIV